MKDVIRTKEDIVRFATRIADKLNGRPYELNIRPFKRPKTAEQRALFHVLVRELAIAASNETNAGELKDWFKASYGPSKAVKFGPVEKIIAVSSEDWTLEEASEMIEHVYRVAAESGYEIGRRNE